MKHKQEHKNQKSIECDQCDFKTSDRHELLEHKKSMHEKMWKLKCGQCQYVALEKHTILEHQKAVHNKISYMEYKQSEDQPPTKDYRKAT